MNVTPLSFLCVCVVSLCKQQYDLLVDVAFDNMLAPNPYLTSQRLNAERAKSKHSPPSSRFDELETSCSRKTTDSERIKYLYSDSEAKQAELSASFKLDCFEVVLLDSLTSSVPFGILGLEMMDFSFHRNAFLRSFSKLTVQVYFSIPLLFLLST